jgi:hypothetical protein
MSQIEPDALRLPPMLPFDESHDLSLPQRRPIPAHHVDDYELILPSPRDDTLKLPSQSTEETKKRGRIPVTTKFPTLVNQVDQIITSNGAAAQERRRTETKSRFGVCFVSEFLRLTLQTSLTYLKDELLRSVDGLQQSYPNFSTNTVARLMSPPKKSSNSARLYHEYVKARPGRCENDKHIYTEFVCFNFNLAILIMQSHKASATVKMALEAFVAFNEEGECWSNDNMNKIHANGTTAVSRYHQPRGFFKTDDMPKHEDHDFPRKGYNITVSGYKHLQLNNHNR